MPPKRQYRLYMLNGGRVPRSTIYYRRKLQKARQQKAQELQEQSRLNSDIDGQHESDSNDIHLKASQPLASCSENHDAIDESSCSSRLLRLETSTSSSDCDLPTHLQSTSKVKQRRKKRKQHKSPQQAPDVFLPDSSDASCHSSGSGLDSSPPLSPPGSIIDTEHSLSPLSHVPSPLGSVSSEDRADLPLSVPPSPLQPMSSIDNTLNSEHANCNQHQPNDWSSETLCSCTDATVGDVIFMTLNVGCKHGLSWAAQSDILKMIWSIYGKKIPQKHHLLLKELVGYEADIKHHIFCNVCEMYLGIKNEVNAIEKCPMDNCKAELKVSSTKNYFLSLSVESQLKTYLKDKNFVDNVLNYRFKTKASDGVYSDIYDGSVYKKLFEKNGVLSNQYNMSYSYFVDGMAFGSKASSNQTIWPIYLTINELPYEERAKYLILAGLYVGAKDPNLQILLQPFVKEGNELSINGVQWEHNNQPVTSRVIPLCCIADSVARYKVLNFQSFAAEYGCTFCYKCSEPTRRGRRYLLGDIAPLRTNDSTRQDLKEVHRRMGTVEEKDKVYRGVKGFTPLMSLHYFSIESSLIVDYMHNILLGTTKHHMELILEPARKVKMWEGMGVERLGMEHLVAVIDRRICNLQSNSSVFREPRPLKDIALWRASEWKAWLLFYSIPCLKDLLKDKYLSHFAMLGKATYCLLQKSITLEEIEEAHKLLMMYTFYFQKYFGVEEMRYNTHLLSHIADGVLKFGGLWTHNSFMYEAQNRYLRKLSKCPSSVILEIAKKFLVYRSLPLLCSKLTKSERTVAFCEEIMNGTRLKKYYRSNEGCVLLGAGDLCALSAAEQAALLSFSHVSTYYKCYQRVICNHTKYCTTRYSEGKKNDDSCVLLTDGRFVLIHHILLLTNNDIVLIVEVLNVSKRPCIPNNHTKIDHIRNYEMSGQIVGVDPTSLLQPCINVVLQNVRYLSPVPYGCTVE